MDEYEAADTCKCICIFLGQDDCAGLRARQQVSIATADQETDLARLCAVQRGNTGHHRGRITPVQARPRDRHNVPQRSHQDSPRSALQTTQHLVGDIHLRTGVQRRAIVDHQIKAFFLGQTIDHFQDLLLEFTQFLIAAQIEILA